MDNELKVGKLKSKELSSWFNISYNTLRNNSDKYYTILREYCDFTPYHGGVDIKQVYMPVYDKTLNTKATKIYMKTAAKINNNNGLFSISQMLKQNPNTVSRYALDKVAKKMFGKGGNRVVEPEPGILGKRIRKWAIEAEGSYRLLTNEENKLFRDIVEEAFHGKTQEQLNNAFEIYADALETGKRVNELQKELAAADCDFLTEVLNVFIFKTGFNLIRVYQHVLLPEDQCNFESENDKMKRDRIIKEYKLEIPE